MRLGLAAGLICLPLLASAARAMQFEAVSLSATEIVIGGRGPIVPGDMQRLSDAVVAIPAGQQVVALALDSPGGSVDEAKQLAASVRARRLAVVIPHNSKCASACFLLLAASPRRLAAADALIGVHSASEDGTETDIAWAVTREMARDAADLGIPPAIIGKMVETTPGRVEWLTDADLTAMNTTVFTGDLALAVRQVTAVVEPRDVSIVPPSGGGPGVETAVTRGPVRVVPIPGGPLPGPAGEDFATGLADRHRFEGWLALLSNAYRDGALYARAQLDQTQPGSCLGSNGASRGDFTQGCSNAWQMLNPMAARMRASRDYVDGWRSGTLLQPDANSRSEIQLKVEYRGAYFCGRQVARLSIKLFPAQDDPKRRALFSFGPEAADHVPYGAFIAEGLLDPHGHLLDMRPVRWVDKPFGYGWIGLSGRSNDGGMTFHGRVTGNRGCTTFTLRRAVDTTASR